MNKAIPRSWKHFGLYLLLLFITATTRDFGVTPLVARSWGSIAVAFVEPAWKLLFWILPMLLFLSAYTDVPVLSYLKLNSRVKQGLVWGTIAGSLFLLNGGIQLLHGHPLFLHYSLNGWLNSVILVGLIEESIFRGFIYQWIQQGLAAKKSMNLSLFIPTQDDLEEDDVLLRKIWRWLPRKGEIWAALLSSLIFAAVHLPLWITVLHLPLWLILSSSLFNLFFGLIQCGLLKYSGSLWACILFHTINDLVTVLLGGLA